MLSKLRPWHWFVVTIATILLLLLLWFGIAYGGLPRLWSHHEHKRIGSRDEIVFCIWTTGQMLRDLVRHV